MSKRQTIKAARRTLKRLHAARVYVHRPVTVRPGELPRLVAGIAGPK